MRWLDARNRGSSESVVQPDGPVVSLTTFEPRWDRVYYTIESIGAGTLKPCRLLLWVAPSVLNMGMPEALVRLQKRGLEILTCEDIGPHKKYFPAVNLIAPERNLVTADDDVLYPLDWLECLVNAATKFPGCVLAHRARTIAFTPEDKLAPYAKWSHCRNSEPSQLHIAVGIGGVLHPPDMQEALRQAGDAFRERCPRADDIWLKVVALRNGMPIAQVAEGSPFLIEVPGMRESGLARHNVGQGGNDLQIRMTFMATDVAAMLKARDLSSWHEKEGLNG